MNINLYTIILKNIILKLPLRFKLIFTNTALALFVFSSHASNAQNQCNLYLTLTNFEKDFSEFIHDPNYDRELPPMNIKDQCQTGHCHLYTWAMQLESVSGIEISMDYIDIMNIYQKAIEAAKEGGIKLSFGSTPIKSRDSILSCGLIPIEAWRTTNSPSSKKIYSKLIKGIESVLLNSKLNSIHSSETELKILSFIQSLVGILPKTFEYNNKIYTPNQFANEYFKNLNSTLISVVRTRSESNSTTYLESETFPKIERRLKQLEFEDLLMLVIDQGKPAYLAYNHHDQFIDSETGIMSISAFNYPQEAMVVDPDIISENNLWSNPHAVLVVGYQKDPYTGRPLRWKIQNSWGKAAGDNGYFHMYSDFFQLHAWSFSFIDD